MVVLLRLTTADSALVDDDNGKRFAGFLWRVASNSLTKYASTSDKRIGANWRAMHRLVIDAPIGSIVDHINGNGLDNRRENLRIVTPGENAYNQYVQTAPKSSRYKGVCFVADRWHAGVRKDGVNYDLGLFDDETEAALAYDRAALQLFGRYARTNHMMGLYPDQVRVKRNEFQVEHCRTICSAGLRHTQTDEERLALKQAPLQRRHRRQKLRAKRAKEYAEFSVNRYRRLGLRLLDA